jgi:N-acetylmuramoyl-L-alanine amidase
MLVKNVEDCSTYAVNGLDRQILAVVANRHPQALCRIDDIPGIILGGAHVHPYMQQGIKKSLENALKARPGKTLTINSACRTIAGQLQLRNHFKNSRCGITAAAKPGKSNHNNLTAIDIEDSEGWRSALQKNNFRWIGEFDSMHYDYTGEVMDLFPAQVEAFQHLYNMANPTDKLAADGDLGQATYDRLNHAPAEGYYMQSTTWIPQRILKLTTPVQIGPDVKELQLALRNAGIEIVYDGLYGKGTDTAVKQFQEKQKMLADGVIGQKTRLALNLSNKVIV